MDLLPDIPEDFETFLLWLKERTEAAWAIHETKTLAAFQEDEVGGSSWYKGTKWQASLTGEQIAAVEKEWDVQFPDDYRLFLSILNAPDRDMFFAGWSDDTPYDLIQVEDEPSWFDWQKDKGSLLEAFDWPLEGLMFDLEENALWRKSWGRKPFTKKGAARKLTKLVAAAPKLIPVTGHRYLLADATVTGNPVLSVYQSDIIRYASDLRGLLLLEFSDLLGYDYEEITAMATRDYTSEDIAEIPFWGEFMLYD